MAEYDKYELPYNPMIEVRMSVLEKNREYRVYTKAARALLIFADETGDHEKLERREMLDEIITELRTGSGLYGEDQPKSKTRGPWYIIRHYVSDQDPMEIETVVRNADTGIEMDADETLKPPFDEFTLENVFDYYGKSRRQQSICITVREIVEYDEGEPREACIQVEIDPETGQFQEDSLHGWEIVEND